MLYRVKHKPCYYFCFIENKWVTNNHQINENDHVLFLDEIDDETVTWLWTASVIAIEKATATTSQAVHRSAALMHDNVLAMAREQLVTWKISDKREYFYNNPTKIKEKQINFFKQSFHLYLSNNRKTIIWKEFVHEL
jgi:hypothetical protein